MSPPPSPFHIGRSHSVQVNALHITEDNERVYSGDIGGRVVCTLTRTFRSIASWLAHKDSILTVQEWELKIITHGRDNKLHVWSSISSLPSVAETASSTAQVIPTLLYSLDVNALNFCRFSLLSLPLDLRRDGSDALIAVPNLVDSAFSDVWSLPGLERIHAAIGKFQSGASGSVNGRGDSQTGIVMSHHLFYCEVSSKTALQMRLLSGYEDGHVSLFARTDTFLDRSVEGKGWDALWSCKLHVESVMEMAVASRFSFALTVSADHLVGKYQLEDALPANRARATPFRTKHPGNSSVAVRHDGRVCAVACWDGRIRLYSTKSFKSLGTLKYHNESAYVTVFANLPSRAPSTPSSASEGLFDRGQTTPVEDLDEDDNGWGPRETEDRSHWLITAGKEGRIAFWRLHSFDSQ